MVGGGGVLNTLLSLSGHLLHGSPCVVCLQTCASHVTERTTEDRLITLRAVESVSDGTSSSLTNTSTNLKSTSFVLALPLLFLMHQTDVYMERIIVQTASFTITNIKKTA